MGPAGSLRDGGIRHDTMGITRHTSRRSGARLHRSVAAAILLVVGSITAEAAGEGIGAGDASQSGSVPLGALLPDDRLTPALRGFEVAGEVYAAAYDDWTSARRDLADARRTAARNRLLLADLGASRIAGRAALDDRRALLRGVVHDLGGLDIALAQLIVSSYTRGGPIGQAAAMFDVGDVTDTLYVQTLEREVGKDQLARRLALRSTTARLQHDIEDLTAELGSLADRAFDARSAIEESTARDIALTARLPSIEQALRDVRMSSLVVGSDLPLVALDAYVRAAARLAAEKPQCGVQWQMIAALGRIESNHGSVNGASLRADGRTTVAIIGIALTGDNGTALVPDTDNGRVDGDPDLDRAVGPMQFIPSTWLAFRRDGNGDTVADPQSIYDSALTAAAYLCAAGRSLRTADNLRRAFFAYNRSSRYGDTALDNVDKYRRIVFPPVPTIS